MDHFLKKTTEKAKSGRNVTPYQRHSEFKEWTHVSGGKLFCTACNSVLNQERKSVLNQHKASSRHLSCMKRIDDQGEPAVKRQRTITDCENVVTKTCPNTVSAEARNELCKEVVSVFAATNIPLSKLDHPAFRTFLQKHVVNGGAIPKSKQLQECYLLRELDDKKEVVRNAVECKPVAVICDEMSDDIGRFVLNILVAPMEVDKDNKVKSYLLDTIFLPRTDHAEVAGAVIMTLVKWNVEFSNVVMTFNTDNAAYMKKAYRGVIKGVMPNCTHITCLAHIMNLMGEAFRKPFENSNKYVKAANAMLWHAGARKVRYFRYLSQEIRTRPPSCPQTLLEQGEFVTYRYQPWVELLV